MAKAKYKTIFEDLWEKNEELFQKFFVLNTDYGDTAKRADVEDEFQSIGKQVQQLLQEGENELCRHMEKGNNRVYSSKLADKYWDEVRGYFKYIDMVGVVSKRL